MVRFIELSRSPAWPRSAALVFIAISAAGCSADTTRFGDPFVSPYAAETTGSVPATQAPVNRVETSPIGHAALPPPPRAGTGANVTGSVQRPATQSAGGMIFPS